MSSLKFSFLLIFLILVSCSHYKSKAENFMKARRFLEARQMYHMHLQSDPDDKEALAGRDKAEFEATNDILVKARNKRESGNILGAIEDLRMLYDLHKEWSRNLDPNFASFRKAELRKLIPGFLNLLEVSKQNDHAIELDYLYTQHGILFESVDHEKRIHVFKDDINRLGIKLCKNLLSKKSDEIYFNHLVHNICRKYKIESKLKFANVLYHDFFSKIYILNNIYGLNIQSFNSFAKNTKDAFESSLLFSKNGNNSLNVDLVGSYHFQKSTFVDYREQTEADGSKVKIYSRYLYEKVSLDFLTKFIFSQSNLEFRYFNNYENRKLLEEGKKINNYPITPFEYVIDQKKWLESEANKLKSKVLSSLEVFFEKQFCTFSTANMSNEQAGNSLIRCAKNKNTKRKADIDMWFKYNFYVSLQQFETVIGSIH